LQQFSPPNALRRDPRLDVLRGLALVMIFINHVPGNIYEHLTSRNFGFSDAAEGFVLMSGIACGLAYSGRFRTDGFLSAALRMWRRARKLYLVHLLIIGQAIALLGLGISLFDTFDLAFRVNFLAIAEKPLEAILGVAMLGHQLAYFNILPLYVVLMMLGAGYVMIGLRSIPTMIGIAIAVWVLAGTFRLNLPNYPGNGGWFFNPLAWQLLFAVGIAGGIAARQGRPLVPYSPWLFGVAIAYLLFSLVWTRQALGPLPGSEYVPFYVGSFDKSYLPLPRLLHILAVAYVLINLNWVMNASRSVFAHPLAVMGRSSLPVFAVGSVLALALQLYKDIIHTGPLADGALLGMALVVQYWVARLSLGNSMPAPVATTAAAR